MKRVLDCYIIQTLLRATNERKLWSTEEENRYANIVSKYIFEGEL